MNKQRIIFRCDGNAKIGYGHVTRCWALAEKLNNLSYAKSIVQFDTANFSSLINQYAYSVGFTNIKNACYTITAVCSTPKAYIYWDDVHFTDTTNSYFGSFMQSKLLEANLP